MLLSVKRVALAVTLFAALAACSNSGKSNAAGSPQPSGEATTGTSAAATPDCHGESPVWASERRKTYVLPGNSRYGKGKSGSYMCLSDAQSQGYHERRGRGRHRPRLQDALSP